MTPAVRHLATSSERIAGVDAARAVALVGMAATHLQALAGADGRHTLTGVLFDGRASALFAVLAGVSIALMTGGDAPARLLPPGDRRAYAAAAAGLAVRAILIGLLGLALAGLDPPVAVILAYYGLLFLAAIPLLRLSVPIIAVGAVLACAFTPVLSHALRAGLPPGPGEQADLGFLADPSALLRTLALTGYYPALPWLTYLLAGLAVGRSDLRRTRTAVVLLVAGSALTVAAAATSAWLLGAGGAAVLGSALDVRRYGTTPTDTWWWLAVDLPHSGTPLDLAGTTCSALAVIGALLLVERVAAPLIWLPAAVGAVPLTLYTLHVVAVTTDPGAPLWAHVAAACVIGAGLRLARLRGPLEAAVSWASRRARAAIARA